MMSPATDPDPPADADGLRNCLRAFCEEADVAFCAVIDESGAVIESVSPRGLAPRQLSEIGALATAAFSATNALSAKLGESGSGGLCQMGERWHYYLTELGDRATFLGVFDSESLVGLVKAALTGMRSEILQNLDERNRHWPG